MRRLEITAKENISAVAIAKWIRSQTSYALRDALSLADRMVKGETWHVEDIKATKSDNPYVNIEVIWCPSGDELRYEERRKERQRQNALLEKGASGDAAAAIEYCKLEQDGKIPHGPCGGAYA